MSRFLVTGGAGFIGGHIVELLVSEGHEVAVLDNFSTGRLSNLTAVAEQVKVHEGDIRDRQAVDRAVEGIDYVIHQAAEISVFRSVDEPDVTNAVNVDGTLNVLIAAKDAGVRRVVMASSSAIYGDTGNAAQREDLLPDPLSPYGASKIAGEYYCSCFWRLYGLETVRLRYFNVFGPRQNPKSQYAAVIPTFIDRIVSGRDIVIHGDGEQTRDFVYVGNVARANYAACISPGAAGYAFNIGSEQSVSINHLAELLVATADRPVRVLHDEAAKGDIRYSVSDISLARRLLGFEPRVGFEEGLKRTFSYFASQPRAV